MKFEIKTIPTNGCTGLYADDVLVGMYSNILNKIEISMWASFNKQVIDHEHNNFSIIAIETYIKSLNQTKVKRSYGWSTKEQWWKKWKLN